MLVCAVTGLLTAASIRGVVAQSPRQSASAPVAIGTVVDVATDAAGRIYVADDRAGKIHVFDRELKLLTTLGAQGRGEASFQALRAVRSIDDSSVAAIDRYLRRIYVWTWRGPTPHLKKTISLPFDPYDLCVQPGRRFLVAGSYEGHRVHEIDENGKVLRSIAKLDPGLVPAIAERISRGNIACTSDGEILLTSSAIPRVELYRLPAEGTARRAFLTPFRPMTMEARGSGAAFSTPHAGFHAAGRGILLEGSWLVGARVIGMRDAATVDSVRWYGIDRKQMTVTKYVAGEGRLFPLGADRALRVMETDGVKLAIVSLARLGWPVAAPEKP